jgi:WD40 repeat protein
MIVKKENEIKEYSSNINSGNNSKINQKNMSKEAQKNNEEGPKKEKTSVIKKYQELKNYKCTPTIKRSIRSSQVIKKDIQFNSIGYQPSLKHKIIFTGANDNKIFLWDYLKEGKISEAKSINSITTRIIFDKNFIITTGNCGVIEIWNINDINAPEIVLNKEIVLNDPDLSKSNKPRIHDLIMLKKLGILVSCSDNKKINLWEYQADEKERLLKSIKKDNEVTCLACDESYGKLLCGTKQKVIMEIDLAEELNSTRFKHSYEKYAFLKNAANYEEDEIDKKIDNFKIMKSLTQGIGQ